MAKTRPDTLRRPQLKQSLAAKSATRRGSARAAAEISFDASQGRNDLLPALVIVQRSPTALKAPTRSLRKLDPAHVREVAASIQALGFCDPPIIDEDGTVLDGLVRIEAAKLIGLPEIPCVLAGHLSATERRLLRLALNRLQEKGTWALDQLKLEFQELVLEDVPLEITGFSSIEIDTIVMGEEADAAEPGPLEPQVGAVPVARPGEIYALGQHRLICGDARDPEILQALMDREVARLVLTDEPYNVRIAGHVTKGKHREFVMASGEMSDDEFQAFNEAWMSAALPFLGDGGVLGSFIDWRGYPTVHAAALGRGLLPLNLIVWAKSNGGMGSLYRSQHELLPLFKKGTEPHVNNVALGRHGRSRSNLWTCPGASSLGSDSRRGLKEHPTVKPVAMLEDAFLDLTNRGEIVLDPFLGSGSTMIAAERTSRRCFGIEIDPLYVDLVIRRYAEVTGEPAQLLCADLGHVPGAKVQLESVTAPMT